MNIRFRTYVSYHADSLKAIIGSGASSKVWIARTDGVSKAVAVKIYNSNDYDDTAYRVSLLSEILNASTSDSARYNSAIMTCLLMTLIPIKITIDRLFAQVIGRSSVLGRQCLIFDLYGASLRCVLNRVQPTPSQVRWIMWQLFDGLQCTMRSWS